MRILQILSAVFILSFSTSAIAARVVIRDQDGRKIFSHPVYHGEGNSVYAATRDAFEAGSAQGELVVEWTEQGFVKSINGMKPTTQKWNGNNYYFGWCYTLRNWFGHDIQNEADQEKDLNEMTLARENTTIEWYYGYTDSPTGCHYFRDAPGAVKAALTLNGH